MRQRGTKDRATAWSASELGFADRSGRPRLYLAAGAVILIGAAVPAARFRALLDCGEDAGAALAAIRTGISGVVFTGRADVALRLAAIAAQAAATLLTSRPEVALDLGDLFFADRETLRRRCAEILGRE